MTNARDADRTSGIPFEGPAALREPVLAALARVVDPELGLSIVDVGLVYGVNVNSERVHVRLTMTSAACPAADTIIEEAEHELDRTVPPDLVIAIELVWNPPWSPARMTDRARRFLAV